MTSRSRKRSWLATLLNRPMPLTADRLERHLRLYPALDLLLFEELTTTDIAIIEETMPSPPGVEIVPTRLPQKTASRARASSEGSRLVATSRISSAPASRARPTASRSSAADVVRTVGITYSAASPRKPKTSPSTDAAADPAGPFYVQE